MSVEIKRIIVNHCSPVLMGCKPAALFMLQSEKAYTVLVCLLPKFLNVMVLRKSEGRLLVLVFEKKKLEETILNENIKAILTGMGYPSSSSVFVFLNCLIRQFSCREFPHEVGLFLGYPVDDVLGFVKHKGQNYKLCGYWKVYGNVEQAKSCFSLYDKCRECVKSILEQPG
jgi:hypothetical protein